MRLAKKYSVSRSTIKRDAKISSAIDAIGEKSPDAKRDILSGKIPISRTQLKELANGSDADFDNVAVKITEGSFERKKPETAVGASGEGRDYGFLSEFEFDVGENAAEKVNDMVDQFVEALQRIAGGNSSVLKKALRECIKRFEGYYDRV